MLQYIKILENGHKRSFSTVVGGAGAGNNGRVGSKTPPCARRVGKVEKNPPLCRNARWRLLVGTGELRLAFRCEGGWGRLKRTPPRVETRDGGCWWRLGTSVSRFNAREGGGDKVGDSCGQQRCLFNVAIIRHWL